MKENSALERLYNGIAKENPTFVLMLGMCPTLAVTTSAINGLGMGLTTAVVLALSNLIISLLRKVIPDKVRIPAFIVIIASFVTIVQLLLEGYLPDLNEALGVYIPLIVVNCIILGRAEAYAYTHGPVSSLFDGIGMGLGFTVALTCIGMVRELLGGGKLFGFTVIPDSFTPIVIFVLAPGAFFVLAMLSAIQNFVKIQGEKRGKDMSKIGSGCGHDCLHCMDESCVDNQNKAFSEDEDKEETDEEAEKETEDVTKEEAEEETKEETEEAPKAVENSKKGKNKKKKKNETAETEKRTRGEEKQKETEEDNMELIDLDEEDE